MDFQEEKETWAKVGLDFYYYNVDLEFPDDVREIKPVFFTKVNGAAINQSKRDAFLNLDNLIDNKYYNGCFCTLEDGDKLGDFFDCLPYGIINKKITGIGATTLELKSHRNSIIVLPTKALAYNKCKATNAQAREICCMYVGSPIGDIRSDITFQDIKNYLDIDNGRHKKFLVVADSLPKVLRVIGEEHYNDFFLMIDEIDTLQTDNTYRPALENVMDYYSQFEQKNRAVVSATLRDFTHPELLKETVITTGYKNKVTRHVTLRHTDNEDYCVIDTIKHLLQQNENGKILIAYNSMDGILVCIKLLSKEIGEYLSPKIGILCGETSKDKAGTYYTEIDEDGKMDKQIVFMTCAYFVGIDINEPCHIISVSTFNQPFTLLSTERMTQIVGRCRSEALSETIIYETRPLEVSSSLEEYKERLIKKAQVFSTAICKFRETLEEVPELITATDYMENIIKYVSIEKVANDYPVTLLRLNHKEQIVPSYFNIDALLERWALHYSLYLSKDILPQELSKQGHSVTENPLYHEFTEEQKYFLGIIKQDKEDKLQQDLQAAKQNLLELDSITIPKLKEEKINEYIKHSSKQIRKFYEAYKKFSPFYHTEYLADLLIEHHSKDERLYKRFINSLALWALDNSHPFKMLMLGEFNYASIIGATGRRAGINVTPDMKKEKMKKVCETYFRGYPINEDISSSLLQCFFKPASTKKYFRIIGLNPMDFQEPISRITNYAPEYLLELLILR